MVNNICEDIRSREELFVAKCIREQCPEFNIVKFREAPLAHLKELGIYDRFSMQEYNSKEGTGRVLDVMFDMRPYKRLKIEVIFNEMS
jgi:hypothetical protein